ncbi:hypothetical protein [Deinococcus soli (ex Cha et al. 2016)]|uniref:Uncharacterized protein n=2 Tax=Deinococcus soli (ex Cha et al. 2016) TaxID=1309411 RepID=A0AAE4BN83_9DEIO|nr:hypothetical protein [Deinococcus soli (ex Cha et al. 2016)]MDR6218466.1 hypothetical protein [Deinococcus soli (ex Cha et al. 2016)]MDR6329206.1 hypothetical protein [Deinococcus soli (ex Cha et al. 2016)]MDR6751479.1 hypothetical protein [Deinococcus soli (ex Cha et al. 2016)]
MTQNRPPARRTGAPTLDLEVLADRYEDEQAERRFIQFQEVIEERRARMNLKQSA